MLLLGVQGSEQDAGVGGGGAVASALSLPVECKRTEVGELQSLRRAAAGVTGDRSSGLSMPVKCASSGDQFGSATIRAVAVLGYDSGDPAGRLVSSGSLPKDCKLASSLCCIKFLLRTLTSRDRSAAVTLATAKGFSDWLLLLGLAL